jgi:hypothetical protein
VVPAFGDANADGLVNYADVVAFVNVALGIDTDPMHKLGADMDDNDVIDGKDTQLFVTKLLGQ